MTTVSALLMMGGCLHFLAPDPDDDGLKWGEEKDLGLDPKNADSDGDGMNDGDEVAAGADPLVADTDGDGLVDGDEVAAGSDPTMQDTDGDSYLDPWEVTEGTDPADANSLIYQGKWPYNPDKKANRGKYGLPNWKMVDQHGDMVELHDFAGHGKDIVFDSFAAWCGPCMNVAAWVDGEEDSYYDDLAPSVVKAIKQDEIIWLSIVLQDVYGNAPTQATAESWASDYPNPKVPVLADENGDVYTEITVNFFPTGYLLDENLDLLTSSGYIEDALVEAESRL